MNSVRRPTSLFLICLCLQLLGLSSSVTTSLWGKTLPFSARPCLWQLRPDVLVPALNELSVCILLRRNLTADWTGFDYKVPTRNVELGLTGTNTYMKVWLFGQEHRLNVSLELGDWHQVCVTWSGAAHRVQVYVNGTSRLEASVDPNPIFEQLTPNGTLSLGVSHYVKANGDLQVETGTNLVGEIGRFRMWAREWSGEELRGWNCADGDVVRWDLQQWRHNCRPPEPNSSLYCEWSFYKINMRITVHATKPESCSGSPEEFTTNWLRSVFPPAISIHNILVSSPSDSCSVTPNSETLTAQDLQGSRAVSNSSCVKCFSADVFVAVTPAANVSQVQTDISSLLSSGSANEVLNLTADGISIRPVEFLPVEPPPTVSTGRPTSVTGPTESVPARPANLSTTGEPADLNETIVRPDTFFRVNLTLSMTGSPTKPDDVIGRWVTEELEVNETMTVLNLIISENTDRYIAQRSKQMGPRRTQKHYYRYYSYYVTFHVQEYNIHSVEETQSFIHATLTSKYENGSVVIQPTHVAIRHIVPANCLEETTSTIYGDYIWPEAFPQVNQEMGCRKPQSEKAFRLCKLHIETDSTSWADPDMKHCEQAETVSDLDNITVTAGNAAEVVDVIQDLVDVWLGNSSELSSSELDSVVDKLWDVVDIRATKPAVGANIINIVAEILLSKTNVIDVASMVLNLTDTLGNNMDFQNESFSLTAPSLALSMLNVDQRNFSGLTFGVSSPSSDLNPEVYLDNMFVSDTLPNTNATISLPSELLNFFNPGESTKTRVQFQFYGTNDLFQDPGLSHSAEGNWTLNSYIVSASINNSHVSNLKDPVVVNFSHRTPKQPEDKVKCMFWDFQKNNGRGGWNSRGCETRTTSAHQTSCLCDHLTHFAVLLDVSRTQLGEDDHLILTVMSNLGCGISAVFLGITLLTYIVFEKLRQDTPSKILINLSSALLGLTMLFLLNSWLSSFSSYGLCIATAATLHYFLLAAFTWMGLEAVHMYVALIKVFNIYIPAYIPKFCVVGWGVPLVIVGLVLAIDKDAYGNVATAAPSATLQSTDQFCWITSDVFFYVTVVTFVLLILLCNVSVFIVVLIQIRRMGANKNSTNSRNTRHDLKAVASLTALLGLTWSFGFFSFGPGGVVLIYLFTIFNSLQGFFIFVFYCLMKDNVRKQWRIHVCCGRLRLTDYSDWSGSVTGGVQVKKKHLVNSDSVASDNTSTLRKVSDSSTGSAPNHQQGA